jgi:hypothetical protein
MPLCVIMNKRKIILGVLVFLAVVEGVFLFASKREQACVQASESDRKICWEQVVQKEIKKGNIVEALDALSSFYEANPSMGEMCHSLTHEIGQASYRFFARGVDFEITPKTAYCSYGFYHGFMEALVINKGDMELARTFCDDVDRQLASLTPDASLQCFHGIGHGTVNNHDPRTWGNEQTMINPALTLCEQVSISSQQRSRCATGVFNGIATFYATGKYNLIVDPKDPLHICRLQKEEYQDACYVSMNTLLLQVSNNNLKQAAAYVEQIPDDEMAHHAMINLASPIGSGNIDKNDHTEVVAVCRSLSNRLHLSCIAGYAFGFLEHGVPTKEYIKPLEFCNSKYLVSEEQNACFEYILSYLPQWYAQEKVKDICLQLDEKNRNLCMDALKIAVENSDNL